MRAWTAIEVREEQNRLEREVATLLGFMLFEYARLDIALSMALAWADGGKEREARSEQLAGANLHSKLVKLEASVRDKFGQSPGTKSSGTRWYTAAGVSRRWRRWQSVSPAYLHLQASRRCGTQSQKLKSMLESMRSIRARLHELVAEKWL